VNTTSTSLLARLKVQSPANADWQRLHEIYAPLIRRWLVRVPGLGAEAEDVAQEVLVVVLREVPRFERRREGSFRAWLRQVTVNKLRTYHKQKRRRPLVGLDPADDFLDRLADPNGDLARQWDRDHDQHVFQKLLATVQPDFGPATWAAFRRFAVEGIPAASGDRAGRERECRVAGQVADPATAARRGRRATRVILRAFAAGLRPKRTLVG
jgi:RNA polymerase sigma-70 factor (ECF subfamily)